MGGVLSTGVVGVRAGGFGLACEGGILCAVFVMLLFHGVVRQSLTVLFL